MLTTRLNPWQLSSKGSISDAARLQALADLSTSLQFTRTPAETIAQASSIIKGALGAGWNEDFLSYAGDAYTAEYENLEQDDRDFLIVAVGLLNGKLAVLEMEALRFRKLDTCDDERARIARDLHDTTVQDLVALSYRLRELANHPEENTPDNLNACRMDTLRMTSDLRGRLSDLKQPNPVDTQKPTRSPTLTEDLTRKIDHSPGIELSIPTDFPTLPGAVAQTLAYIAIEAARNALHHANAKHIRIALAVCSGQIILSVTDDGVGFVFANDLLALIQAGHFGLAGMFERARCAGGDLSVQPAHPGTIIQACIPLHP